MHIHTRNSQERDVEVGSKNARRPHLYSPKRLEEERRQEQKRRNKRRS